MAHGPHSDTHTAAVTAARFLTGSLDNWRRFVDHSCVELDRADLFAVTRKVVSVAAGGAGEVVNRVAEAAEQGSRWDVARCLVDTSVESLEGTVRVLAEEQVRTNIVTVQSRLVEGALDLLRRQALVALEAAQGVEAMWSAAGQPATVTRVEIEPEGAARGNEARVAPR